MSIVILTEEQAAAVEYYVEFIKKMKEVFLANRSILKAGDRAVNENVFIGLGRAVPTLPAIRINGDKHAEEYLTFGSRENTITFTVGIEISNEWADNEANELYIHQLGDRLLEVIRKNEDFKSIVRQIERIDVSYSVVTTDVGGFVRVGSVYLTVVKDVSF